MLKLTGETGLTVPANLMDPAEADSIANVHSSHIRADSLDDAYAFMAQSIAGLKEVLICSTYAGVGDLEIGFIAA